ncbi:cilia- and flagella- associated protein 210 isoform X2 [Struthio camelus]|uniref:cilia- and flagella- associated protein 210 isoform X2 n=1 Tax=Struthio camelus TaxID=8801 RepID=UPI003603C0C3
MAAAKPGRRRELAPLNGLAENNVLDGYFLPSDVDLHQVIVLPKAEWERIQDNLGSTTREAARILAERKERKEMHLRSKAAIKDWPNTIMGLAQRKLKAKKLCAEREEEERRLTDLEEAQFQAAKRKEAIDQARTYQYYKNERVKGLHSALLLTKVLKERDAQVEFKKLKRDVNKKKEEEMEHECKKAILREQEKDERSYNERYMKRKALCRDQLEQIKEHKHQAELAKLEDKREGEEIQRLTRLYQLEIQRGKEKEQAEKLERRRLHHEHVADQKIIKAVEEQKQEEEDDRIRAHFKAKQIIAKLRNEKETEMQRLMQEHQDIIVNRLAAQMSEAFKMEDDRIAKDIVKQEAKQEKERKDKEEKKKADIESIAEHRATVGAWPRSQVVGLVSSISMLHQVICHLSWGSSVPLPPHVGHISGSSAENPGLGHWPATLTVLITALKRGCFC